MLSFARGFDEKVIMQQFIDHRAPKTHEYTRYILATILEQSPLTKGANVEIDVIENQTPFPKLVEMPEGAPDTKRMSAELTNWPVRLPGRFALLYDFTNDLLGSMCTPLLPTIQPEIRTNLTFNYVIDDPQKIYDLAVLLGLKLPAVAGIGVPELTAPPTFSEKPPEICWRGEVVSIPLDSKQFYICRIAFHKDAGEAISWDEVVDEIDGEKDTQSKTTKKSIYDAIRQINKKTIRAVGQPLFEISTLSFYRTS